MAITAAWQKNCWIQKVNSHVEMIHSAWSRSRRGEHQEIRINQAEEDFELDESKFSDGNVIRRHHECTHWLCGRLWVSAWGKVFAHMYQRHCQWYPSVQLFSSSRPVNIRPLYGFCDPIGEVWRLFLILKNLSIECQGGKHLGITQVDNYVIYTSDSEKVVPMTEAVDFLSTIWPIHLISMQCHSIHSLNPLLRISNTILINSLQRTGLLCVSLK